MLLSHWPEHGQVLHVGALLCCAHRLLSLLSLSEDAVIGLLLELLLLLHQLLINDRLHVVLVLLL